MYGGIVFLLLSFVGVAKALTEQKTIKVSTATEFQEAVGDYTTIVLANDIIIPWQNSTQGTQYGIHVQQRKGLVIEGNGFKLDGDDAKSAPPNYNGPPAMTVEQSDITINDLTVTNFGCFGGAITLRQGTTALISNSFLIKNVKYRSCSGLQVFDTAGNPPADVTLNNVTIDGNAGWSGGGISALGQYRGDDRPTLTMIDCKVTNNIADYRGAGIYVDGAALFLKGVMFKDNVDKGTKPRTKDTENDVYLDMNANCNDCWTSSIDISQCPEDEFKTIDEGSISVDLYPYGPDGPGAPVDPRSYSCLPK